eukprot:634289-Prorocentrum_minimum.AAC.3
MTLFLASGASDRPNNTDTPSVWSADTSSVKAASFTSSASILASRSWMGDIPRALTASTSLPQDQKSPIFFFKGSPSCEAVASSIISFSVERFLSASWWKEPHALYSGGMGFVDTQPPFA